MMDRDDDDMFFVRNNVQVIINTNAAIEAVFANLFPRYKQIRNDRPFLGREWIMDILEGHPGRCKDLFRMSPTLFMILCHEIEQKGIVTVGEVTIEEQVGKFLQILAHGVTTRKTGEDFQRSTETVHRYFDDVLHNVIRMRRDYIILPGESSGIHHNVAEGSGNEPFKNALGAIDGTFIPCIPPSDEEDKEKWRNRKGDKSQNVLDAVDFDGNFVYVLAGWEGAAHDNLVLRSSLSRFNFRVPPDRFYLADLGYANTRNFITPYRNYPYWLGTFRDRSSADRYRCPKDLYNHKHAQLRNIVERTFGILKERFKILVFMHKRNYNYKKQCKIVIACCILHNFIKKYTVELNDDEDDDDDSSGEEEAPDQFTATSIDVDATDIGGIIRQEIRDWFWAHHAN